MARKLDSKDAKVDWEAVELATEIARTYEIETVYGGTIFKQYKPSIMKQMRVDPKIFDKLKWKTVKMVGVRG